MDEADRDSLLLEAILDRPIGEIANIVQAARENEGTLYDRLSKGYREITARDGGPDDVIGLKEE